MRLRISCVSDVGRVRDNNEDMASVGMYLIRDNSLNIDKEVFESESFCLLVSDGMGGHESGEYASQFTLEALRAFLLDKTLTHHNPVSDLALKIKDISACLNIKARERHQGKAMGCTLTGQPDIPFEGRDASPTDRGSDTSREGLGSASRRESPLQLHRSGLRHRGRHSGHKWPIDGIGQDSDLLGRSFGHA